jgi:hypothetical protein
MPGFDRAWAELSVERLRASKVRFRRGLSESELSAVEEAVGADLPPELRTFYSVALPASMGFARWRRPAREVDWTKYWIERTFAFDIEFNGWWAPWWGERPVDVEEAKRIARAELVSGPPLVHIYSHRFMTTEPRGPGNPVLSVYQAVDTIYYGYDLANYLSREFDIISAEWSAKEPPRVPFWGELFDLLEEGTIEPR